MKRAGNYSQDDALAVIDLVLGVYFVPTACELKVIGQDIHILILTSSRCNRRLT